MLGAGVGAGEGTSEGTNVGFEERNGEGQEGLSMAAAYVALIHSNIELANSTRDMSQHSTCLKAFA